MAAVLASAAALATAAGTVALASQNVAAGTAKTAGRPASGSVPGCHRSNLSAGLHGSQVGLGNRGFILTLTNTGNSSCALDGYPGLGLENGSHHGLSTHTSRGSTYFDHDPGAQAIVLSPGETASADVSYPAGGGIPSDAVATFLQVTPPNAHLHLTVRIPGAPVRISHGRLFVTAMARHTRY